MQAGSRLAILRIRTMHKEQIDKVVALLENAPRAQPSDYTSLGEFAAVLLQTLAEQAERGTPDDELLQVVGGMVRRSEWYENAVLCDLRIIHREHAVCMQFLRNWKMQAYAWNGNMPPYRSLLAVTYRWLAVYEDVDAEEGDRAEYTMFPWGGIPRPNPDERLKPPPPRWIAFFLRREPPEEREALEAYLVQLSALMGERRIHPKREYYDYYMACHCPELQRQYLHLLGDMHREDTPARRRRVAMRHIHWHRLFREAFQQFSSLMERRMFEAVKRAEEMGMPHGNWGIPDHVREEMERRSAKREAVRGLFLKWRE